MKACLTRGLAVCLLSVAALASGCAAPAQSRFDTPEQATASLIQALRANDHKQLSQILGSDAEDLISSGDAVSDQNGITTFLQQYDTKHNLVQDDDDQWTLQVGPNDWPLPIPITRGDDKEPGWYFDTPAGMDEIISRRVGHNELATIQVCLAIVDAQREYAFQDSDGNGLHDYAEKFLSDPGKKNGLYWETAGNEKPSPLGPLVVEAADEGYSTHASQSGKPQPFHGYRFRMLKAQGPHAVGGVEDYIVHGKMIGGFAVVAYPADYGVSGVMTFIVNDTGVLYQRDLGEKTETTAASMTAFDPGPEWIKVEPPPPPQP